MDELLKKYNDFVAGLAHPDKVGQAEYRLVHEYLAGLDDGPQTAVASLRETAAWADHLANRIEDLFLAEG